jgi:hypothetical protein
VINHDGITLDLALYGEVATEASIGNITIFERTNCELGCFNSCSSIPQNSHGSVGSIVTRPQMDFLVLKAMITSTSMNEDGSYVTALRPTTERHWRHRPLYEQVSALRHLQSG